MKVKILRAAAGCIAAAVLLSMQVFSEPVVNAKSAVLLDGTTGRILYEKNGNCKSLIASTTKIMTGLIIAEECDLDAKVRVPAEAVGVEGSSVYLKEDEVLTVETLLYGMMLHSGNDAAAALAIYCAGSLDAFAEKMNLRAQELGLNGTNYVNPHGLDAENHYSTAIDLALLSAAAMDNDVFRQVVSTKSVTMEGRSFSNHNKMLWRYKGAVGVKTGYTLSAGRILVSAAERDGRRLICVTIRDRSDWNDHENLLDFGFSSYTMHELAQKGQSMAEVPVIGGAEHAHAVITEDIFYSISKDEKIELIANLPVFVYAPILAGEPAGTLSVLVNGREVMSVPMYWKYSVFEEA